MATLWLASDLHLEDPRIIKHRKFISSVKNNSDLYIEEHKQKVKSRDRVIYLGDVTDSVEGITILEGLAGEKILVKGNHDLLPIELYLNVFKDIMALWFKSGYQLSHAPVHPRDLRGRQNVHGHKHSEVVRNFLGFKDKRYINICPERLTIHYGKPTFLINIQDLRQIS